MNDANATETTGSVTTSSGGEEVDGSSSAGDSDMEMDSGADWLLGDEGDEGGESSSAASLINIGYVISILLFGSSLFV